ncbi:hypothetical protein NE237_016904 [Protea cynaroides]|uniref:RNase H type-1 domain-containing protein n=1 Tax=Protea cynaroides TaxID=273540 RepID=A0A9Q0HFV9_9MAGN|nr:hypothetical protein NE237_016904 [Protea cynaroides]
MQRWKAGLLLKAEKEVLLKSVALPMSNYVRVLILGFPNIILILLRKLQLIFIGVKPNEVEAIKKIQLGWFTDKDRLLWKETKGDTKLHQWLLKVSSIKSIPRTHDKQVFSLVAFMCWNLWKVKDEFYFDHVDCRPLDVIHRSKRAWKEFFAAVSLDSLSKQDDHCNGIISHSWSPPPEGYFKLNSDAACNENSHCGIGFIIRKVDGSPHFAKSQPMFFPLVATGEALAIREGLSEALKMGIFLLLVESDCLEVINLINGVTEVGEHSALSSVKDIRILATRGVHVSFHNVSRGANRVAHSLVRTVLTTTGMVNWHISTLWLFEQCTLDTIAIPCSLTV